MSLYPYAPVQEQQPTYVQQVQYEQQQPNAPQAITIFVPYNELMAIQQKYPHPHSLVPVTIVPTPARETPINAEIHYHDTNPQGSTKPTFLSLGQGVLGLSILYLLLCIVYVIFTSIFIATTSGSKNNGYFTSATVFAAFFLITTCVGIASGAHTVGKRDQYTCTIITLVGQVVFLFYSIISTIVIGSLETRYSWYDGQPAAIFSKIFIGIALILVLPGVGVSAARIAAYKREAKQQQQL